MRKLLLLLIILVITTPGLLARGSSDLPSEALVNVAAAHLRAKPSHSSELVSQAVMGTPVKLLNREGDDWWLAETPDGYQGYIKGNLLHLLTPREAHRWRASQRVMSRNIYTARIVSTNGRGTPVSDVHNGSVLEVIGQTVPDSIDVKLPDGRRGRLSKTIVTALKSLKPTTIDTTRLLTVARALQGVTYLWGGTTTAAMDCSGLTKICYLDQGFILPRDASQQALVGDNLGSGLNNLTQGDLIFFKSARTGNIIHVAIYDRDSMYVHSSGRVKVNSINPSSRSYIPGNVPSHACRYTDTASQGLLPHVTTHPMYVNP